MLSKTRLITGFLAIASSFAAKEKSNYEKRKEELLKQLKECRNFPRKEKKQAKKSILLDWRINEYSRTFFEFL